MTFDDNVWERELNPEDKDPLDSVFDAAAIMSELARGTKLIWKIGQVIKELGDDPPEERLREHCAGLLGVISMYDFSRLEGMQDTFHDFNADLLYEAVRGCFEVQQILHELLPLPVLKTLAQHAVAICDGLSEHLGGEDNDKA